MCAKRGETLRAWLLKPATIARYYAIIPDLLRMIDVFDVKLGCWKFPRGFDEVESAVRVPFEKAANVLHEELKSQAAVQGRADVAAIIKAPIVLVGVDRLECSSERLHGPQELYKVFQSLEIDNSARRRSFSTPSRWILS